MWTKSSRQRKSTDKPCPAELSPRLHAPQRLSSDDDDDDVRPTAASAGAAAADVGKQRPELAPALPCPPRPDNAAAAAAATSGDVLESDDESVEKRDSSVGTLKGTKSGKRTKGLEVAPSLPCPPREDDDDDDDKRDDSLVGRGQAPSRYEEETDLPPPPADRLQRGGGTTLSVPGAYRVRGRSGFRDSAGSLVWGRGQSVEPLGPLFAVSAELVPPDENLNNGNRFWTIQRKMVALVALLMMVAVVAIAVVLLVVLRQGKTPAPTVSPTMSLAPSMEPSMAPTFRPTLEGVWVQLGQNLTGKGADDNFGGGEGVALSSDGTVLAVGAPGANNTVGHVYVYRWMEENNNWTQIGQVLQGERESDKFGECLSLSSNGTILAVAAPFSFSGGLEDVGRTTVFKLVNNTWEQQGQKLFGQAVFDQFGFSVSLSGDGSTLAVGSNKHYGNMGQVHWFSLNGGSWILIGQPIKGEGAEDKFGSSVALSQDGSMLAVGGPFHFGAGGSKAGHARVFRRQMSSWTEVDDEIIKDSQEGEQCGEAVSLSYNGTIIAIGCIGNNGNGEKAGAVRIYHLMNSEWAKLGQLIQGEKESDQSGRFVSLSSEGTTVAIGAHLNNEGSGHARIFRLINGDHWAQVGADIDGVGKEDFTGKAVSLSGDGRIVAIGAGLNDAVANNSGLVRVFELQD